MVFSKDWLSNLLKHHNGINIPCSRLIESGKMLSGQHAISRNCGRNPKEFDFSLWEETVNELKNSVTVTGGLFMPCVFEKEIFILSGMYPEGNIYDNGVGTLGRFVKSGDAYYFDDILNKKFGLEHKTVFDSLVYHIQEGEKDS
jgi:hypothetical protein